MRAVVIGIDPHKRSNTALVLDAHENVLAKQRFPNDPVAAAGARPTTRTLTPSP